MNRSVGYGRVVLPKKARAIPIQGKFEDSNKYFRCKICGFICNADRDRTGPGEGVTQKDATELAGMDLVASGDQFSPVIYMDDPFTILQNNADDDPIGEYRHNNYPYVYAGCPNCGSKNWK